MSEATTSAVRFRAVPAAIAVLAVAALVWLWLLADLAPQWRYIGTYVTALLSAILVGLWWLLLSGGSWRRRIVPLALALGLVLVFFALVRVRGVTGDWLPVLEWRFGGGPEADRLAEMPTPDGPSGRLDEVDLTEPAAFPGFLGEGRDSRVDGLGLAPEWVSNHPRERWRRTVGPGWGGIAIAGRTLFTQEQRDEREAVVAYDLESGAEVWRHEEEAAFSNPIAGPGPRTTPAISADRVYALGATGLLVALDRRTGELAWRREVVEENGARLPEHGKTSSPLLVDDLVVVSAGGANGRSLVAYRARDGEPAWGGGGDASGYASPVLMTLGDERQIVSFNAGSVSGHDPASGEVLWRFPWNAEWPNVATPLQIGPNSLVVSTGYGIGISRLDLVRAGGSWKVSETWHTPRLKAKFTNLVFHQGSIYGLDEGVLVCLDPDTGERRWRAGRYGHGNVLLADDRLFVLTERGEIRVIEPRPEELVELTRFQPVEGKTWNHFAIARPADEILLAVRNDRELTVWSLPAQR